MARGAGFPASLLSGVPDGAAVLGGDAGGVWRRRSEVSRGRVTPTAVIARRKPRRLVVRMWWSLSDEVIVSVERRRPRRRFSRTPRKRRRGRRRATETALSDDLRDDFPRRSVVREH